MADDQRNKRLKTTSGANGEVSSDDARNGAIESENHALGSENARVRLCEQLQLQGNHEAPTVGTLAVRGVDLSRIDTSLIIQIASFVGTSSVLLDLALTCKSFGLQQPPSGLDWSLAEEVARQAVSSGQNGIKGVRIVLPQYARGTMTWLSILHESERPLEFDMLLGRDIEYAADGRNSVRRTTSNTGASTAVASKYVMESGIHYTEFQINAGEPFIGIVRPMSNLDPDRYADDQFDFLTRRFYGDCLAARGEDWGAGNVHACGYDCEDGDAYWTDWGESVEYEVWEGMVGYGSGDTVGMLLNLDEGTLTVYKNNYRLGIVKDGLSGAYCWYATVFDSYAVSMNRGDAKFRALYDAVIKVFRDLQSRQRRGVHVDDVVGHLTRKGFSEIDIRKVITCLSNEGHLLSTTEHHYLHYGENEI